MSYMPGVGNKRTNSTPVHLISNYDWINLVLKIVPLFFESFPSPFQTCDKTTTNLLLSSIGLDVLKAGTPEYRKFPENRNITEQ